MDETELPEVLLMENVPDVIGQKNIAQFAKWIEKLESLGYKNYWKILNAKDYGIPQNRERCYMISLRGDYYYDFPKPVKLGSRLEDFLEEKVDKKYYLSEKALNGLKNSNFDCSKLENRIEKNGIVPTLSARDYKDPKLVKIAQLDGFESSNRVYSENGLAPTINTMGGGGRESKIAELIHFGSYYTWENKKGEINTQCNRACDPNNLVLTIPTIAGHTKVLEANYRIRKLTPKECWRLMGLSDTDFDKAKASGVSNSQLYKQAGNGIVVDVLAAIFKIML
jgi:DNA (cytosine-5)-methyltransferase 1